MTKQILNQNDLTGVDERRLYAALSYVTILVLVPLLTKRDDPFVSFHARQGLVILLGLIITLLAAMWLATIGGLLFIVLLIIDVIALVTALQGRRWKIPGIGMLAEKFKI